MYQLIMENNSIVSRVKCNVRGIADGEFILNNIGDLTHDTLLTQKIALHADIIFFNGKIKKDSFTIRCGASRCEIILKLEGCSTDIESVNNHFLKKLGVQQTKITTSENEKTSSSKKIIDKDHISIKSIGAESTYEHQNSDENGHQINHEYDSMVSDIRFIGSEKNPTNEEHSFELKSRKHEGKAIIEGKLNDKLIDFIINQEEYKITATLEMDKCDVVIDRVISSKKNLSIIQKFIIGTYIRNKIWEKHIAPSLMEHTLLISETVDVA